MPLFLKIGRTTACFMSDGKMDLSKLAFIRSDNGEDRAVFMSFNIFAGTLSYPTAEFAFILSIRSSTSEGVVGLKVKPVDDVGMKLGSLMRSFSNVFLPTVEKKWLK